MQERRGPQVPAAGRAIRRVRGRRGTAGPGCPGDRSAAVSTVVSART
ncbi:Hypothetical protein SCLAV_0642 [Streptomyces clavuligerus]|uniref:Uncharacterized protein n=1 Tax=Streptomyces clavuligerus TaxID=1901 RepID=E2PU99_STRCL|nr:Hypothetical protein SCLAV_0642 [Streptomyces clavuligerus]